MQQQVAWKRSVLPSPHDISTLLRDILCAKSTDSIVFYNLRRLAWDLDISAQTLELQGAGTATTGLDPSQVVGRLKELAESGRIRLFPCGWMTKAHIVRHPGPARGPDSLRAITEILYEETHRRLEAWTRVRRQGVELFTENRCTTVGIAEHFGAEMPGGRTRCGRCDWCRTGKPFVLSPDQQEDEIDREKVAAVLAAVLDRDHPRFLARVATGCRSLRVHRYNLDKSPGLGSMRHVNFDVSL